MAKKKRVALVLGAGGTLGAAWMIGGLAAIQDRVGRPLAEATTIIGTSAGSVVAAAIRHGFTPDQLVAHQLGETGAALPSTDEFERDSGIWPSAPRWRLGSARMLATAALAPHSVHPRVLASALLPEGRSEHHTVRRYVQALVGDTPDRWPRQHTWIVGVDYEAGRRIVFGRAGSPPARLPDAVVASCSIPGWHRPAVIGGRRYVDGGVRSIASVDLLRSEPYDEVYVLAPMASSETDRPWHPAVRAERMVRQLLAAELRRDVAKVERTGAQVTVLTPGPADLDAIGANLMDGRRRAAVLGTAQQTIPAALAA
ncbi:NTE family protein [Actinoplanes octamycinicus]|uniref:NTE family protein n=1 Tax=Actinoplanes octamycinicus TaxID=135948 RepID=A0A7W7MAF7_9ACTN|nr:patatin-like phospholipase family protein [Actinoplanes octamycinicus]MBB4742876.1 NTE family protein [Actinoplanes octamycinicus]GIE58271.1 patatin [Actinoplanes octamycinicus]